MARCKRAGCGREMGDVIHWATCAIPELYHPFEPEDAAPAAKLADPSFLCADCLTPNHCRAQWYCEKGNKPSPQADKGVTRLIDKTDEWESRQDEKHQVEPVAQSGAGGERQAADIQVSQALKAIGERYNWNLSAFFADMRKKLAELSVPAAGQVGAEQWLNSIGLSHLRVMYGGEVNLAALLNQYAAHVTMGLQAELVKSQKYGRTEYGIEQLLRKDLEAAEARNVELQRERDLYKGECAAGIVREKQLSARNVELMGELERAQAALRKFVDEAMELGLDIADNGSGWHNERAESAETRLAEAQKAVELVKEAWIVGAPNYELGEYCVPFEVAEAVSKLFDEQARAALTPSAPQEKTK